MDYNDIIKIHKKYNDRVVKDRFESYCRNLILPDIYSCNNGKILVDLACGHGMVSKFFIDLGYKVYGVEIDEAMAKLAEERGVKIQIQDIQSSLNIKDNFTDEVFWGDNIEHLYCPEAVIKEISRILKPNGRLIISTVNYSNIIWRLKYLFSGRIPLSESGDTNKNVGYWEHIRLWNDDELVNFICGFGFFYKHTYGTNYFGIFPKFFYKKFPKQFSGVNIYEFIKI
jgi:2-polyprenyl-3-methyl-5-hydroxy-6-metoxy-1,4-benzoquinol methylase